MRPGDDSDVNDELLQIAMGRKPLAPEDADELVSERDAGRRRLDQRVHLPGEMVDVESKAVVRGSQIGSTYVRTRVHIPDVRPFQSQGPDKIEATEVAIQPRSRAGWAAEHAKRVVIGQRLPNAAAIHERLSKVKALAVLSSDAISSVAYATEASLGVLIVAGSGALAINPLIALAIVALMIIVGTSYFQTIHAYPGGGGSYIVARDNLGDLPGLIAAGALLIDYVLTVSVSVSSGIDAIVSVVTPLARYDVPLGVLCILFILLINLRGVRESGTIFAAPTYVFIGSFLFMILAGVLYAATHGGLLSAIPPTGTPAQHGWDVLPQRLGLLLILTSFAAGCVAMTGTEAISNGIPAFKPPESRNAGRTLLWMVAVLATLYIGTTYLAWRFGLVPYANQQPTLDAQIANLIFIKGYSALGFMYYVVQVATLIILVLAANTSFADFPRLSSILARDGFLPHFFAHRGDRLAFSVGIIVLGALSMVLLVVFKGSTEALINLYALGVFTAFTLSQSGMVLHWWRLRDRVGTRWRRSLVINTLGASTTGVVAVIIIVTKFSHGAWLVVILVPLLVLLFRFIARHYHRVREQVSGMSVRVPADIQTIVLVPIAHLDRVALRSIVYAETLAPGNVIVVHVVADAEDESQFRAEWNAWVTGKHAGEDGKRKIAAHDSGATGHDTRLPAHTPSVPASMPRLVVIESPYRSLVSPLVSYVEAVREANTSSIVTVVLPEFVPAHWWEYLLHNQT
ncbi:MAG: APC family permease, partial [Nitrososphaerota archaeon]